METKKQHPKGHYTTLGIAIGAGAFGILGVIICMITDNMGLIGIGPAVGIPIGLLIGQSLEGKKEREGRVRELTVQEKQRQRIAIFVGVAMAFFGILAFLLFAIVNS